jgi:hypothetical protein
MDRETRSANIEVMGEFTNINQMQYVTEGTGQADTRKWAQQSATARPSASVPAQKPNTSGVQKKSATGSSPSKKSK